MAEPMRFGQVVWVSIADHNGISKKRPAVVVTPDDDGEASGLGDVVAITSTLQTPLPEDHVLLPWHAQGHPRTGLKRKCAAVCSWVVQVSVDDIESVAGSITGSTLAEIVRKIRPRPPATEPKPPSDQ
jgi:mRNA-degrading endonuclease toxin of MazEF toxin-antitoxin module